MRTTLTVFIIISAFLFSGICFAMGGQPPSPEEEEFLSKVDSFPMEVVISSKEVSTAWGRAQEWIGQYSSMKLQIVTDYVIQTYNPGENEMDYGYYVTKIKLDDDTYKIKVQCNTGNIFAINNAKRNARLLAYYIKMGETNPNFISR